MGIWDRVESAAAAGGLFMAANCFAAVSMAAAMVSLAQAKTSGEPWPRVGAIEEAAAFFAQACAQEGTLLLCEAWEGQPRS